MLKYRFRPRLHATACLQKGAAILMLVYINNLFVIA